MTLLIAKLFLRLLNLLPAGGPYWLAKRLAPLWMKASPVKLNSTIRNLERCFPDMDPEEREQLVKQSFIHYVATVLETGHNWYRHVKELEARCEEVIGIEAFNQSVASERGVMMLVPHCGAWEYLGLYMQRVDNLGILYKPPSDPKMDEALLKSRGRGGAEMIPATPRGVRTLFSHLKNGHTAGVLPDQEPSRGQGRFVPFFGVPALTGVLFAKIAQRTNCHVYFGVCQRLSGGRCRVHIFPADDEIHSDDLDTALGAVNRGVERCVEVDPAQYLWSYKRFKTRPEGEPPFYV